jgi:cell pole-organizing protein PopZ
MTTSNHNDDDQEMSMDEILASIRRYVSSDEPIQKESTQKDEPKPAEPLFARPQLDMNEEPHTQRITPRLDMPHQEEVLRLNEDSPREERQESLLWTEEPIIKSSFDANKQDQRVTRSAPMPQRQANAAPKSSSDGLVSDKTLATTMESFARLRDASVSKTPKYEPVTTPGLNPTLDQLFESLARPMIREWLDRNLPPMVERMVMREIERITKS